MKRSKRKLPSRRPVEWVLYVALVAVVSVAFWAQDALRKALDQPVVSLTTDTAPKGTLEAVELAAQADVQDDERLTRQRDAELQAAPDAGLAAAANFTEVYDETTY